MRQIDFLIQQIVESRDFVNRLISELPKELWYTIPENTDSNFIWQIGHLMISQNFHAITCITGRNDKITKYIPIPDYIQIFYGMGSLHRSVEKDTIQINKLIEQFNVVHSICIDNLSSNVSDDFLLKDIEPIPFIHPIARTKYEALSWCFKHEMWHSAEMEAIKLALGYPIVWIKNNK